MTGNGGRITDNISDRKLTHIIMDDGDSGRYVELVRKTAEWVQPLRQSSMLISDRPKRKHIILPSWVAECMEEETLMNEDGEWGYGNSLTTQDTSRGDTWQQYLTQHVHTRCMISRISKTSMEAAEAVAPRRFENRDASRGTGLRLPQLSSPFSEATEGSQKELFYIPTRAICDNASRELSIELSLRVVIPRRRLKTSTALLSFLGRLKYRTISFRSSSKAFWDDSRTKR